MKFEKPRDDVCDRDLAFGPLNLSGWLPGMKDIPKEFFSDSNKWNGYISNWFFRGLKEMPIAKEGINFKNAASHIRVILASYDPKHEHKIAGCAYLASLWLDERTLNGGKFK